MEVMTDRNASAVTERFLFQVTISREFGGSALPPVVVLKRAAFALPDPRLLALDDAGSARVAGSALADGITPSSRTLRSTSRAPGTCTRTSDRERRTTMAAPKSRPEHIPKPRFSGRLGIRGKRGAVAGSPIRALLVRIANARLASLPCWSAAS